VLTAALLVPALDATSGCGREDAPQGPASEPSGDPRGVSQPGLTGSGPGGAPDILVRGREDGAQAVPVQVGELGVDLTVASLNGGTLAAETAWDGSVAFRPPAFSQDPMPPRAVIRVRPDRPADLSPGLRSVAWGADFQLDGVSTGTAEDNGDNLLQRGLASDPGQFKAELDLRRPGCSVVGSTGRLTVRAEQAVEAGRWYRMRCLREGDRLTVFVWEIVDGQLESETERQVSGPVGPVSPPATAPLSVAGKLTTKTGDIVVSASDQFNGLVANAFVDIL
jgi:hypothetical protein